MALSQKLHAHLFIDVNFSQSVAELIECDSQIAVDVKLGNGPLGNGNDLLLGYIGADKHAKNTEQLFLVNLVVVVSVVKAVEELELVGAAVYVILVGLAATKCGKNFGELTKVELVLLAVVFYEHLNDTVTEGVDVQLGDAE